MTEGETCTVSLQDNTKACLRPRSQWVPYRCAAAGVEQEVGGVGRNRRLVRDWPVAQCHANNGCHVGFCAKDVNGDPSGLA